MIRHLVYILITHLVSLILWASFYKNHILLQDDFHLNVIMLLVLSMLNALILDCIAGEKRLRKSSLVAGIFAVIVLSLTLYRSLPFRLFWILLSCALLVLSLGLSLGLGFGLNWRANLRNSLRKTSKSLITFLPISNHMVTWFVLGLLLASLLMIRLLDLSSFMTGMFLHFLFLACEFQLILFLKEKHSTYEKILQFSYIAELMTAERDEFARIIHDDILQDVLAARNFVLLADPQLSLARTLLGELDTKARYIMQFYRSTLLDDLPLNESLRSVLEDVAHLYPTSNWNVEVSMALDDSQSSSLTLGRALCIITKELVNNIYKHSHGSYIIYKLTQEEGEIRLELESDGAKKDDLQKIQHSRRGLLLVRLLVEKYAGTMTYQLENQILTTQVILKEDQGLWKED